MKAEGGKGKGEGRKRAAEFIPADGQRYPLVKTIAEAEEA
jgi:hypothetical protein